MLKKLTWSDKFYRFDLSATFAFRIIIENFIENLNEICTKTIGKNTIITNQGDIIKELTTYRIRINDSEPIELKGNNKELELIDKHGKHKDKNKEAVNIPSLATKSIKRDTNKKELSNISTTCRQIIENIQFDTNSFMANFP